MFDFRGDMVGGRVARVDYVRGKGAHGAVRVSTGRAPARLPRRSLVARSACNTIGGMETRFAGTKANTAAMPVGGLLRAWRERRRLGQHPRGGAADISARHVIFLEAGRSVPSRAMLLRLAERLEVPLRERNALLLSAGYAPMYSERRLDDPALRQARTAVDLVIAGHSPHPALAIDRHWTMVAANATVNLLLGSVDPRLLQPPVNVLRLSLHPGGLGAQVENYT